MALVAGTRLGPYEILGLLGEGGMGAVYRARDPRLRRDVAIKVLADAVAREPDRLARFEHEARAVAALNHPHILTIHDVGVDAATGRPYVVTELLEGETWREVLARRAPTPRQVLTLAHQAAQGLAAAHARGLVHRDLKPENLFLTTDGRVKILDFGLAKLRPAQDAGSRADKSTATTGTGELTDAGLLVGTLPYMAPEQVLGHPVDARADVFAFGVVLYEMLARRHPFRRDTAAATVTAILHDTPPALAGDDDGIPAGTDALLRRCLARHRDDRFADGRELVQALDEMSHVASGAPLLRDVEERGPYPGLRSFTEQDAAVFFGRENEVTSLWARIRTHPLLAVIGPSGAGKTSFLRAGVIPARPAGWRALACTPGTAPLRMLGQALAPALASDPQALSQLVSFDDPEVAFTLLRRWRRAHDEALVVFDQFEELFTLNAPEVQARVAMLVGRLVTDAQVHVVVSLRDDFLMRCHEHAPLAPVFEALTPLGAITRANLRRALVEPARKRGYRFEDDELVEEMAGCVEGARAALPLLAFAVARLWELRDREARVLTRAAYEQIGGVAGALAQHAEATLDRIGSMQQDLVRGLFRNLVTAQGTRAVIDRDELLSALPEPTAGETVLGELVDARLLTSYEVEGKPGEPGRRRVEIAHESLLKAWPRLVRWTMQDEEGAVLRDQLKQAAHLWDEKGRTADLLWTGTAFREYALWRGRYPGALTAVEEAFARAMAARDVRRKRTRRVAVAAGFTALAVIAVAIGISRQQAVASARRAEASQLVALAQLRLSDDPTEALALATASLEQADTKEARAFAVKALLDAPPALEVVAPTSVSVPAFSPDGRKLAATGWDSDARVYFDDARDALVLPGHQHHPNGPNAASWASDDLLVTGLGGELATFVHLWSMPAGERLRTIDFQKPTFWEVAPGRLLVEITPAAESDTQLRLRAWALPDGEAAELAVVDLGKLPVKWSHFAPDGRAWLYNASGPEVHARPLPPASGPDRLVARFSGTARLFDRVPGRLEVLGDTAGEVRVWRYRGGDPQEEVVRQPGGARTRIQVDQSGRWLIDKGENDVRVSAIGAWPGARPLVLRRSGSWFGSRRDVHPSGDWVVASTGGNTHLTFWPLGRPRPIVVDGYSSGGRLVVFSPDGRWLATNWPPGNQLRLWPLPGTGGVARTLDDLGPGLWIPAAFDASSRLLLACNYQRRPSFVLVPLDGSPARWLREASPATDSELQADPPVPALSPSGRRVAASLWTGQREMTLQVWDVDSGLVKRFALPPSTQPTAGASSTRSGYERGVLALAFADDNTIFTAGDGGLRRWNLETGTHELVVTAPPGSWLSAAFSHAARRVLTIKVPFGPRFTEYGDVDCRDVQLHDTRAGTTRSLTGFGNCGSNAALDASGEVAAVATHDGTVRVGRPGGEAPHLLVGHKGTLWALAISPDLRWVATAGEDATLRLWPMPDLSKPPLHTLPHSQLIAKLRSLTNLRAVRDAASSTGWKIEVGPFPGWKEVPGW